ncbi:L,D-transpeptidase [Wenjunlia tyrosinilytica]|uniref:L,D-transpeptidase n=1 Tax=Wenjunlia tyrosinilytica TaxID=1544741 RepID=UPI001E5E9EC2|nr:Ig-like domain-containing protein [Wenjunlia tyrosinilytica]
MRPGLASAAVVVGAALSLTACTTSGSGSADSGKAGSAQAKADQAAARQASDASITITPKNGANNVNREGDVKVRVAGGKLTAVSMTAVETGKPVTGAISPDGTSWEPSVRLDQAMKYRLTAVAKDPKGRQETKNASFATLSAANTVIGFFTPEDGSTVGVGMPVSINFNKAIQNRARIQKAITVTSTSGQQVVGHWFSGTRLDFRPQEYWKSGSKVTLKLRLKGVQGSAGVYGVQSKDVTFTVGRSQVSTVDTKTHRMTVTRDGKVIKTLPISAGGPDNPTYNGQMVIAEKFKQTRMNGATVGFVKDDGKGEYDIPDVPHAMRLTNTGTFVHGNYWGKGVFGKVNTSHGCIGVQDVKGGGDSATDAAWFFDNSITGDVVNVVHSPDRTVSPDNGLNGWNLSWAQWKAGSAA